MTNKLTIITTAYKLDLLKKKVYDSIHFEHVHEWIIVYDGTKIAEDFRMFKGHPKIKEYVYRGEGISGNPQRNYALSKITEEDTFLYYLDDDNIIHPKLYDLLVILRKNFLYTFDREDLKGNKIQARHIDTAMFLVYFGLCKELRWKADIYEADGIYISDIWKKLGNCVYVPLTLCYYNKLSKIQE